MSDPNVVDAPAPVDANTEISVAHPGDVTSSNIKICFKKGAFPRITGKKSSCSGDKTIKFPPRMSQSGTNKRKATENFDSEIDEPAIKRVKADRVPLDGIADLNDSNGRANKTPASPAESTASTSTATTPTPSSPKKEPLQAPFIFRKLAKKLADQPALLEDLKAYRETFTAQRRQDAKAIITLQTALDAATKETTVKDLRNNEDQRAMQNMIEFWTDAYNKEFERAELIKEHMRGFADDIETLAKADVASDNNAGPDKLLHIELELENLLVRMYDSAAGMGREGEEKSTEPLAGTFAD